MGAMVCGCVCVKKKHNNTTGITFLSYNLLTKKYRRGDNGVIKTSKNLKANEYKYANHMFKVIISVVRLVFLHYHWWHRGERMKRNSNDNRTFFLQKLS